MTKKYHLVTLEDIAKKLKVSKVTVSKALRNHSDISTETTEKVKNLAAQLGYVPNIIARNLSSRKSNTIGLVVPKIAHVFFSTVIEAIYDAAFKNNYEILLTVSQEHADREAKHIQTLLSMKVDGLIISVTEETKELAIFNKVAHHGIPLVFIDRVPGISGISSVTVDDFGGAYSATEYAIKKGYRRIGHLGGYQHINIGKARYSGFVKAMEDHDVKINPHWITQGGFSEEDGYNGFMKIYKKDLLPQYILAVTYPVALGMYSAANEVGIRIPDDIEVTCFGKNTTERLIPSVFNLVDQPAKNIGSEAIKLMIEQINNPKSFQPKQIQLKTSLIINSTASKQMCVL